MSSADHRPLPTGGAAIPAVNGRACAAKSPVTLPAASSSTHRDRYSTGRVADTSHRDTNHPCHIATSRDDSTNA